MDDADRADAQIEALVASRIAAAAARPGLPLTGVCHNCGEPAKDAAFCSTECRDDWEKRREANSRLGKG